MNKIVGITGYMSVGKSYVLSKLLSQINKDYVLIDVDIFRRKLLKENSEYVKELKLVIPELNEFNQIDSVILNKYIYSNGTYMEEYKKILYKYLFDYIDSLQNKLIFIEWALIINDNLIDKFNKLIVIDSSYENRLNRLIDSDLSKEELLRRFKLQEIENREEVLNISNVDYIVVNNDYDEVDYKKIIEFIGR